ncbi:hypothetical protein M3N55_14600 [Roseibaca sp. V10]|uniref:Uncharacterized protein n=1 Tax=Roseinatronobacter domitianus TaxID=2940293 RepID=A0ABT0M534_9RHOB|nr:hypothetical protein [Roseibaca domitiana]MCL1629962.1 hypothetical protein [Roseibaca domitiana]
MVEKKNPCALAGATGAGLLCYAKAPSNQSVALSQQSDNAFNRANGVFEMVNPANQSTLWLATAHFQGAWA